MENLREKLKAPMPYKWRVQSVKYGKASCVAYVDARQVMDKLDDVFGVEGWSDNYSEHKGNLFCTISVMTDGGIEIQKTDCGTESNVEKQKGEASDAFKRAAVKFGIGRFLYDLKIVVLKTAKHTNDKEYPSTDDGKILWGAEDLSAYIIKHKVPKERKSDTISPDSFKAALGAVRNEKTRIAALKKVCSLTLTKTQNKELSELMAELNIE